MCDTEEFPYLIVVAMSVLYTYWWKICVLLWFTISPEQFQSYKMASSILTPPPPHPPRKKICISLCSVFWNFKIYFVLGVRERFIKNHTFLTLSRKTSLTRSTARPWHIKTNQLKPWLRNLVIYFHCCIFTFFDKMVLCNVLWQSYKHTNKVTCLDLRRLLFFTSSTFTALLQLATLLLAVGPSDEAIGCAWCIQSSIKKHLMPNTNTIHESRSWNPNEVKWKPCMDRVWRSQFWIPPAVVAFPESHIPE